MLVCFNLSEARTSQIDVFLEHTADISTWNYKNSKKNRKICYADECKSLVFTESQPDKPKHIYDTIIFIKNKTDFKKVPIRGAK